MTKNEDKLSEILSYLEKTIEDRKKSKNKSKKGSVPGHNNLFA